MMLMEEAERIAKDEHGAAKLAVISGIECIPSCSLFFFSIRNPFFHPPLKSSRLSG